MSLYPEKRGRLALGVVASLSAVFAGGIAVSSCVDSTGVTKIDCPPFVDFQGVSPVLEQRCGTLDCHGQQGRALRIYGNFGMRAPDPAHAKDPNYYPGGQTGTTTLEQTLNYEAVCALEPEIITEVAEGKEDPGELTLVRKPRLTERHKGGRIWDQGKAGDRCLTGWLKAKDYKPGNFDASDCIDVIANPND